MRKSGFAAAAGLGSLALLLTACGGSSGSSSTSSPTTTSTAKPGNGAPSSAALGGITPGSTVLHVQKSAIGWVLALSNGQVVYAYDKDPKGGSPACTGSCAQIWKPVTGKPLASPAAGSGSSAPLASSGSGGAVPSTVPASSATAASTATKSAGSTAKAKPHKSVAPLPSGGDQSIPARGTTVMIVQKSAVGYVLAEA